MIYDLKEAQEAVLEACRRMKEEGLIVRTWGNVSARLSRDEFLITPSGRDYDDMEAEDLVIVNIRNLKYDGKYKPSSEKAMHAKIYERRPQCGFIVHTHQQTASAVSVLGEDFDLDALMETPSFADPDVPVVTKEERASLGSVLPCAEYGISSTKKLAKNVAKAVVKNTNAKAVLMRCHGAVIAGRDAEQAMQAARDLENVCAKIYEKKCGELIEREQDETLEKELPGGSFLHVRTPFTLEMSKRGKELAPYLDDMAQIAGPSVKCIGQAATAGKIQKALKDRDAVFVKGDGAICIGRDADDAECVALVLEKNCMAANIALKKAADPVPRLSSRIERRFYLKKYRDLKEEK